MSCCNIPIPDQVNCSGVTQGEFESIVYNVKLRVGIHRVKFYSWDRDEIHIVRGNGHTVDVYNASDIRRCGLGGDLKIRGLGSIHDHFHDAYSYRAEIERLDRLYTTQPRIIISKDMLDRMKLIINIPFKKPTMKITKTNEYTLNTAEVKKIITDHLKAKGLLDGKGVLEEKVLITLKGGTLNTANTTVTVEVSQAISEDLKTPVKASCSTPGYGSIDFCRAD